MAKKQTDRKKVMAILSIIFGILVIMNPAFLAWIVGLYLIVTGVLSLMG